MMKKAIACLILTVTLIISALTLNGCDKEKNSQNPVLGKTGAMLLLANERLSGRMIDEGDSIFENAEEALVGMADQGRSFIAACSSSENEAQIMSVAAESSMITDIANPSRSYTQFNETVYQSVSLAERGADMIKMMKENVRVLDTWVVMGNTKMLLHVEENSEILLYQEQLFSYACFRTRMEDGTEKYELIQINPTEGYTVRASYIKGELYECSNSMPSRGIDSEDDYFGFSAQKSNNGWECVEYRYYPENEFKFNFEYVILSDDLSFKATKSPVDGSIKMIVLSSGDRSEDIMAIEESENQSNYHLYLGAFNGYRGVMNNGGEYDCNLVLADGTVLENSTRATEGEVGISYTLIFDSAWGTECEIVFTINGGTADERNAKISDYIKEIGITRSESMSDLLSDINKSREVATEVDRDFKWNGYSNSTADGREAGHAVETAKFDFFYDAFEKYADNTEISIDDVSLSRLASFADMINTSANVTVEGTAINVKSAAATVSDLTLFTAGDNYHLAFALMDADGLIHLSGYEKVGGALSGESLTLTAENITLSINDIAAGKYDIVMYASTSDGIRSSKPAVIGNVIIPDQP